jgi:hypothetical protein
MAGDVVFTDMMYLPESVNFLSHGALINRKWPEQPEETGGYVSFGGDKGPRSGLKRFGHTVSLWAVSLTLARGRTGPHGSFALRKRYTNQQREPDTRTTNDSRHHDTNPRQ